MAIESYALTTLARVKTNLPNLSGSDIDTLLENLIDAATDFIESLCERRFKETDYSEELYDGYNDSGAGKNTIRLNQFPIDSGETFLIEYKSGESTWVSLASTDYIINHNTGVIRFAGGGAWPGGYRNIRVTYTAGYVIDFATPANNTLPYDLARICDELVVRKFKRREHIGKTAINTGGDNVGLLNEMDAEITTVIGRHQKLEFL